MQEVAISIQIQNLGQVFCSSPFAVRANCIQMQAACDATHVTADDPPPAVDPAALCCTQLNSNALNLNVIFSTTFQFHAVFTSLCGSHLFVNIAIYKDFHSNLECCLRHVNSMDETFVKFVSENINRYLNISFVKS